MKGLLKRSIPIALGAMLAGLLLPAAAAAQPATSGSVTMTSDPGDFVGAGLSYDFSTEAGDSISTSTNGSVVSVAVFSVNGDFFFLDFAAPGGQPLVPGTYTGATRYPFNASNEPGLSVVGNGRGCNTLTGSFTVTDAAYAGPDSSYLERFDASFEQHCEGADPALRGQVHIANPPPPAALELGLGLASEGTVSSLNGRATVHGTVTCTQPVTVSVFGTLVEVVKRTLISGSFSIQVACTPEAPVDWSAVVAPNGTTPFQKGDAQLDATANALDPNFGVPVGVSQSAVVRLKKA